MVEISQGTIAVMMRAYKALGLYYPTDFGTPLVTPDQLYEYLYGFGFHEDLLGRFIQSEWDFSVILPKVKSGRIMQRPGTPREWQRLAETRMSQDESERILRALAEALLKIYKGKHIERDQKLTELIVSLQDDGFEYREGLGLVEAEQLPELREELSGIEYAIQQSPHKDKDVLKHHFAEARRHYSNEEWGQSASEWRKFFEELIRGAWRFTRKHNARYSGNLEKPVFADVMAWLQDSGFLTSDERTAYGAAWGFLSLGSHPGITESEMARLCMIMAVSLGSALLTKLGRWNGTAFSQIG